MSTETSTSIGGTLDLTRHELPSNIRGLNHLRYSHAVHLFARIDLYGYVPARERYLLVVGDGDNGCYEWAVCDEAGKVARHSDHGWGGAVMALQAGLNEVLS
jgi:hypothetical protein